MYSRLFQQQDSLDPDHLLASAKALGLDESAFADCLDGKTVDIIRADVAEGRRLGVRSTPTFFVGVIQSDGSVKLVKRLVGAPGFGALSDVILSVDSNRESE